MIASNQPTWELYETFLKVMQTGSLSAASRALLVAQPTIRRRIEALESALGTVLFTRATNGLVPTDAANATLAAAEAMEAAARAFTRLASAPQDAEGGTVRITASEVVGTEVLPALLAPLLRRHRSLHVEVVTSNRLADLLRRDADLAVRMAAPTQASLVARRIGAVPIGLFATRDYLSAQRAPKSARDLASHALVGQDRERGIIAAIAAFGLELGPRDFVFRSDNDLAQLAAVRSGVGIGVCQLPIAARDPQLVRVLPGMTVPLEMWLVMHEDQRRVRRVRLVFEHLQEALGQYLETRTVGVGRRAATTA